MKAVVTGGAGFIGSAVVRLLVGMHNVDVVNVDKLTYAGNLESLKPIGNSARYSFRQVDICDRAAVRNLFQQEQPDAVMHLAAESHVDRSIEGPEAFLQTNLIGTGTLLQAALAYWRELGADKRRDFRFLHVSTDEVYGDLGNTGGMFVETT